MYSSNGVGYGPGVCSLDIFDGTTWHMAVWKSQASDPSWQSATVDLSAFV